MNSDSQRLHSKKGLDLSNLAIQRLKFSGIFQKLTLMCDLSQLHFFLMGMRERSDQTMPKGVVGIGGLLIVTPVNDW